MTKTNAGVDITRKEEERKTKSWMDEGNPECNGREMI
jgi:hypothetical protein